MARTHIPDFVRTLNVKRLGGDGLPLILLHGWGRSSESTRPLGELLTRHSTVYVLDLPGFGKSPVPDEAWGSEDYAECILHWMDKQSIEQADILGHSVGGKVALTLASSSPERVNRLILLAASGLPRRRTVMENFRINCIRALAKGTKTVDGVFGTQLFEQRFIPRFGSADYRQAGAMRPTLVRMVQEDVTGAARQVQSPTLILWGERDAETPPEMADRFEKLIRGSKKIVFPGLGHDLTESATEHLCARYILPFLQGAAS